jgi:DNA-binding response OmpR family regulator
VVENEALQRGAIGERLEQEGLIALEAHDGMHGLEQIAQQGRPDVILSSIDMPRMNGLELLIRLRMSGLVVPFVFLSSQNDNEKVMTALRMGATDFVERPLRFDELVRCVNDALELSWRLTILDNEVERLKRIASRAFAIRQDLSHYAALKKADS